MAGRESSWVKRIAGGDRTAFEELYAAYARRLCGYLFRKIGDPSRAEEVANDVLLDVWKGAKSFAGRSRLSTWIFGIAHHKAVSALRRRRTAKVDLEAAAGLADTSAGAESRLAARDASQRVRDAIESLPVEQRDVVELTFFHDFSYPEISEILKCPIGTVKTRMFHARRKLAEILRGGGTGEGS